ncbi:MAG: 50S ribosomal protein L15 [Gemmatimonadetes bacterium]|nr:50S ribosomal protein L15 [Gemmatimonadota bacterium]
MAKDQRPLGLHNLPAPRGATSTPKRKGRGPGSGLGKTAGRGQKGQRSRAGGNVRPGFEGGQMPLIRRVPKRGFWNRSRVRYQVVNVRDLGRVKGDEVTPATLIECALIAKSGQSVKILGFGEAERAFSVRGCALSKTAREKIEGSGGRVEA